MGKAGRLFLVSQNLSLFGSSIVGYAIIWHITLETSSGVWMMFSAICALLPQMLISLFGGVLADRYNRKYLIMLADCFVAMVTLALAISFLLGFRRLELLLIVSVARSIGAGLQTPAVSAIFPQLVPEEKLTKVQGINQTLVAALMLLSPAAGGLLLSTVGIVWAFIVDVITAALAVLVMSRIRVEKIPEVKDSQSMYKDILAGIAYIYGNNRLRRIIICGLFGYLLITPAVMLRPLMIERAFGHEVWRLTASEIVWSAASVLGGIFVSLKGQFRDKTLTMAICISAFGVMFGLLGVAWNFLSFLAFMGIAGFFMPVIATALTVYIQENAPSEVLGRVFSVTHLISTGSMLVAIMFFGPLADVVKIESILLLCGALLVLVGVLYGLSEKGAKTA